MSQSHEGPSISLPPWPAGDERGMANTLGPATWWRAAEHLMAPGAKCYELSHEITNTMPTSPFSKALELQPRPTRGRHAALRSDAPWPVRCRYRGNSDRAGA